MVVTLPDHLSYSQVNTYLTCPLRYRFQYVEQIPAAFVPAALAFGSSIHEAVGAFYQSYLIGEELRLDQMVDVYRQEWSSREAENIRFNNGDDAESLMTKAKQMLTVFHDHFDPTVQIIGVEEFFEVGLVGAPPLQGYIDLIEQDHDGRTWIVDLKTASRKPANGNASQNLQLTCYNLAAVEMGFAPESLSMRLDVLTKTKNPELTRCETTRTDQQRRRFFKLVQHVWKAIEREVFFPKTDWQCSTCAWADPCAKW